MSCCKANKRSRYGDDAFAVFTIDVTNVIAYSNGSIGLFLEAVMPSGYCDALQMAKSQVEREMAVLFKDEADDYISKRPDKICETARTYHVAPTDLAAALVSKQPPED